MADPVAWFEITGPDAGALQNFYAQAFDWQVDADNEMNYGMVTAAEGGIGGGVGPHPTGGNHATFYVAVDDVQAALSQRACAVWPSSRRPWPQPFPCPPCR